MFNIKEEIAKLPHRTGVYIMKNLNEEIIYVGKAKDLRKRVSQYFINFERHDIKTRKMVPNISEFEYIVTDSESEALILECNLIKTNKPKYNILLKDDKRYPYIKMTLNEKFPRIYYTRNYVKDKSKYFGPYTDLDYMKKLIEVIYKVWKIRMCKLSLGNVSKKFRPCLNYHIGLCDAPCTGKISEEVYDNRVKEIINFLDGKTKHVLEVLENKMKDASRNYNFEEAAKYRDYITEIENITEKQKMQDETLPNQDIIAFYNIDEEWVAQVFYMREGKLVGREHYFINNTKFEEEEEIENAFLKQYYVETNLIPSEIIIEKDVEDKLGLEEFLTQKAGHKVNILIPQKGKKYKLLQLAKQNAQITLRQFGEKLKSEKEKREEALQSLKQMLDIDYDLDRIEAYDISNIQGVYNVASMVVYENGLKKPSDYRKFKIRSVIGPDDYSCMKEVIERRFMNYFNEDTDEKKQYKFNKLPDLVLVDGGRGQLNIVEQALRNFELDIIACGIVKDDKHNTRGLYYKGKEMIMDKDSEVFKLLVRIQDEVHRFAIEYFRQAYTKTEFVSELDKIEGIGKTRRIRLLKYFGSLDKIKKATVEEMEKVDGMNKKIAENVWKYFRN